MNCHSYLNLGHSGTLLFLWQQQNQTTLNKIKEDVERKKEKKNEKNLGWRWAGG